MEAVILAAGEGKRMRPLTINRPKPLLPIAGKPIIAYHVERLKKLGVKRIWVVVNRNGERIKETLGTDGIEYVRQEKPLGTGHALLTVEDKVKEEFLLIFGDTYFEDSLEGLASYDGMAIGVYQVPDVSRYGAIVEKDGKVECIKEKSLSGPGMIFAGVAKLNASIFSKLRELKPSPRGEIELTDALIGLGIYKLKDKWLDVGYPWNLLEANEIELKKKESYIKGEVEEGVTVRGKVIVEEGALVKSGTYIEGPVYIGKNCVVGPNSYLRAHTMLEANVKVGFSCEVKNSIVMRDTKIPHLSYVGDSIIGEHCNFGAGLKIANLRFDEANVKVTIKGVKQDSGRRKFGAVIGDNVKTGVNVSIMPGVKIGANSIIGAHTLVFEDVEENTYYRVNEDVIRREVGKDEHI